MSEPTAAFITRVSRAGGELVYTLYELTVTYPVTRTWYLAEQDLAADALYTGSLAYDGLVLSETSPVQAVAAIGGQGGAGFTLVLSNHLGSKRGGGPARRFADWMMTPPFTPTEPPPASGSEQQHNIPFYDFRSATLTIKIAVAGLTSGDVRTIGFYRLRPDGIRLQTAPPRLILEFEDDRLFERPLPRRKINAIDWPNAPTGSLGHSISLPFGASLTLPAILVDPGILATVGSWKYLVCESPTGMAVTNGGFLLLDQNPGTGVDTHVKISFGSQGYSLGATVIQVGVGGNDIAFGVYHATDSRLLKDVTIELSRGAAGATLFSQLVLSIEGNLGGIPFGSPFRTDAVATLNASTITDDTTFRSYTFTLNKPVILWAGYGWWWVLRWRAGGTVDGTTIRARYEVTEAAAGVGGDGMGLLQAPNHTTPWNAVHTTDPTKGVPNHACHFAAPDPQTQGLDQSGNRVFYVQIDADTSNRRASVALDGIKDDGSGTYTGTASQLITDWADIAYFLARHPIALGLSAVQAPAANFTPGRGFIASLAGAVFEEAPAWVWLARLGRTGRGFGYRTADGTLALWAERMTTAPTFRRLFRAWEVERLESLATPEVNADPRPHSRIEVYYARDYLGDPNEPPFIAPAVALGFGPSQAADWNGYYFCSPDGSYPKSTTKEAKCAELAARYGLRSNNPGGEVGEGAQFHFAGATGTALFLLQRLFDTNTEPRDPLDTIEFLLPRMGLALDLMDEIEVESDEWPSQLARAPLGGQGFPGTQFDGGTMQFAGSRRGRFSVRLLEFKPQSGAAWPVRVVAQLVRWITA